MIKRFKCSLFDVLMLADTHFFSVTDKPVAGELQTSNQLVFAKGDGVVTYLQKCPGRPQACHSPEAGAGAVAAVQAHPHTAAVRPSAASSSAGAVTGNPTANGAVSC